MNKSAALLAKIILLFLWLGLTARAAAPLVTSRNSTLSVPTARIATNVFPWATNLVGSKFMLSSVVPNTPNGGHASLVDSLQWMRLYHGGVYNSPYDMALRTDGSVVVCGYSTGFMTDNDFCVVSYSPDGNALWTNRYDGPAHGQDVARALATSPSGEVWVLGESRRQTVYIPSDLVLIHYASNGIAIWTNRFASFETNSSYSWSLEVDPSGNAYVLEHATAWLGGSGTTIGTAINKFDPSGNLSWTKRYPVDGPGPGDGLIEPEWIKLDAEANLIVGGSDYSGRRPVVKFAGDGTPLWTNYPTSASTPIEAIRQDKAGNLILASDGWNGSNVVYHILKCSSAGVTLWSNQMAGPFYFGGGVPQALSDFQGNVFAIGGTPGKSIGYYDVARFDAQGIPLWTNQAVHFGSTNGSFVNASVDSAGNLWLLGHAPTTGQANSDIVVLKFSSNGSALWTNRFDGAAGLDDYAYPLAVDSQGGVYVSGSSYTAPGSSDLVTLKFADNFVYVPPVDFAGTDTLTCTLTDSSGNTATGNVTILVLPTSFRFTVSPLTNTGLHLQLSGLPGSNGVVLEASSNLISWQRILTNRPTAGAVEFLDSSALIGARRFYRASQEP